MSEISDQRLVSFIVPAHNEELWVGKCVSSIQAVMAAVGKPYEILVVDDASTDATPTVAEQQGARVIRVTHRHISATRNSGAREAHGEVFFFVDADTLVNVAAIQAALEAMQSGATGGGCVPRFDEPLPLWFRLVRPLFDGIVRGLRQPGGSCLFCTRHAFATVGGFSEAHYAAEDAVFVSALKRQGPVVLPAESVLTSGRNLRAHSCWSFVRLLLRLTWHGPDGFRRREGLDYWYQPKRNSPQK